MYLVDVTTTQRCHVRRSHWTNNFGSKLFMFRDILFHICVLHRSKGSGLVTLSRNSETMAKVETKYSLVLVIVFGILGNILLILSSILRDIRRMC